MPATFILAPMAIALREQGVKIKIVYLGHRDGSAVMVHKDSGISKRPTCAANGSPFPADTPISGSSFTANSKRPA